MTDHTNPEDIFDHVYGNKNITGKYPVSKTITQSSAKVDDGVRTIEDRVIYWQEFVNHWRITIIQNEQVIILFCILFGISYSYAINECTGNLDFPVYVYLMTASIIALLSLLLITEGSLPLLVLVKFGVSLALGHVSMMFLIAVDGHTWHLFTVDVCRYPITTDSFMVFVVGGGAGYIIAKFEEIRVAGGIK